MVSFDLVHQGGREPWVEPGAVPDELEKVLLKLIKMENKSQVCL